MSKRHRMFVLFVMMVLMISCRAPTADQPTPSPLPDAKIVRHPEPVIFDTGGDFVLPEYDPDIADWPAMDVRSRDLSMLDLSDRKDDLFYTTFDSQTQWPSLPKMPADFDWQKVMEICKDPGLGIKDLHQQGINGTGIGIAIIDGPLLVDHVEYKDRLRLYEEVNILPEATAAMHGVAVTSIAVGKTVGVAPNADLYYIGAWTGDWAANTGEFTWNFSYYAQAIHRILVINQSLPEDRKVRVIAMQADRIPNETGGDELINAINEVKAAGIFVISPNIGKNYGLYFQGLGRNPLDDPNLFASYGPGLWWEKDFFERQPSEQYTGMPSNFYREESMKHILLIPMDSRTTASPTGIEDYVFYRQGGWSWSIPYIAGMYALTVQVQPDITPEEFWQAALQTGRTIQLQHNGKEYEFGVILDPKALIEGLQSK